MILIKNTYSIPVSKNVSCARRDSDGDILGIGGYGFYHPKNDAIHYIECKQYVYFVNNTSQIFVKNGQTGKYLTTSPDGTTENNLDNIKECSC